MEYNGILYYPLIHISPASSSARQHFLAHRVAPRRSTSSSSSSSYSPSLAMPPHLLQSPERMSARTIHVYLIRDGSGPSSSFLKRMPFRRSISIASERKKHLSRSWVNVWRLRMMWRISKIVVWSTMRSWGRRGLSMSANTALLVVSTIFVGRSLGWRGLRMAERKRR